MKALGPVEHRPKKQRQGIWTAYNDTGALRIECPRCGARRNKWCTKPDGRVRRIPCIERATATAVVTVDREDRYRDFSEPLHEKKSPMTTPIDRDDDIGRRD